MPDEYGASQLAGGSGQGEILTRPPSPPPPLPHRLRLLLLSPHYQQWPNVHLIHRATITDQRGDDSHCYLSDMLMVLWNDPSVGGSSGGGGSGGGGLPIGCRPGPRTGYLPTGELREND